MTEPHEEAFSMCCRRRESILNPFNFFTICEITAQNTLHGTNGKTEGVVFQKLDLVSPPAHPLQTEATIHLCWHIQWAREAEEPAGTEQYTPTFQSELDDDVYSFSSDWTASQHCNECVIVSVTNEKS